MALGDRILKVNHAGERGAISIYSGQLAVAWLTAPALVPELREMRCHERRHLGIFWSELERRRQPRCKSYLLCALGGFFLGIVTGIFGKSAIAATTVAVERVVLQHLSHQIEQLQATDAMAVNAIQAIIADETSHHDQASRHVDPNGISFRMIYPIIARSTESVIWLGMKL